MSGAELVVYSSAIKPGNPAFDEAVRLGLPMVRRADALAAILNCKRGIVIAGMHGKTTTSSMARMSCGTPGLKPSHYVGAEIPILGTNARWDPAGEYFRRGRRRKRRHARALHPEHAHHPQHRGGASRLLQGLAAIEAVYTTLVRQTRGKIFYCADDAEARAGWRPPLRAVQLRPTEDATTTIPICDIASATSDPDFKVLRRGERLGSDPASTSPARTTWERHRRHRPRLRARAAI